MTTDRPKSPWTIPVLKQYVADKLFLSPKQSLLTGGLNTPDLQLRRLLGVENHPIRRGWKAHFRPERPTRSFKDWQILLGRDFEKNKSLPKAVLKKQKQNSMNPLLQLPGELVNMIESYFNPVDMIAFRLTSRDLFTGFFLSDKLFVPGSNSAFISEDLPAIRLLFGHNRKLQLLRLENQGKLSVRLHRQTQKMLYCRICETAHIESYFTQSQLLKPPQSRVCIGNQSYISRARLSQLNNDLGGPLRKEGHGLDVRPGSFKRWVRFFRGYRMTVKRHVYLGTSGHMWEIKIRESFGQEMESFLDDIPLCRHARNNGRRIQELKDFARSRSSGTAQIGLDFHDVSRLTGRYRTFGTWWLCRRPQCRTRVRFLTKRGTRWFRSRKNLTVRVEMARHMRVPKHVNSRRWRKEVVAHKQYFGEQNEAKTPSL